LVLILILGAGCSEVVPPGDVAVDRGDHGGRLLRDGQFELELAIVEAGIEPEFRAWTRLDGQPISPQEVVLEVSLERLGGRVDTIEFDATAEFLRSRSIVAEPHSFDVTVVARHGATLHRWQFDQIEGRTRISSNMAEAFGITTERVGPAEIKESISTRGRVTVNPEQQHTVNARFEGIIRKVNVVAGDAVTSGQILAEVESDDSLNRYALIAPGAGVVVARDANTGEHTAGRTLFRIVDTSSVWVELGVFPRDRSRIAMGQPVVVRSAEGAELGRGRVDWINVLAEADQRVIVRTVLANPDGLLVPGDWVTGTVEVADHPVDRTVLRSALQSVRQFTVVFERIGEDYEVRVLELGRGDDERVEVLGGIEVGASYVTANSYLVKADIEKSSASHEH
jgi:cobalt-zinc-cadmium efflux system membrane fusion protein